MCSYSAFDIFQKVLFAWRFTKKLISEFLLRFNAKPSIVLNYLCKKGFILFNGLKKSKIEKKKKKKKKMVANYAISIG